ncbi:unnamed protein product [Rotaria sordida]|uniref:F-box protein n=1 Tax=Rotaria sordida TaxID=392033 RepID=A0A815F8G8_9BILA|nr:unnamed protein product [Rotaria sordida]CAF1586307.1 unnamed protein product [Rotaria sordida]
MKILDEYHHLCNLTYLTINSCNCGANQSEYQSMINSIWSLPKLIKCSFNTCILAHTVFQIPTNISSSLESASIPSHGPELNQLHTLIECTPCLNRLHLQILRLQVEQRTFGLSENIIQERADKLLKSFQTSFWTNQHHWFVRCFIEYQTIYLFTLSKTLNYDELDLPHSLKLTDLHYDHQEFYNSITSIQNYRLFDQPISSYIRLPHIKDLRIKLPLNDQFWSIVPSVNILETLIVYSHADSFQYQLQVLLDRAPNLRCLDIRQDESLSLQMSLFQYRTSSVRQLDFRGYNYYFNEEECIRLCHSSLCIQCGVLFIRIKSRHSTIYLVKNMINLRSLHVKRDDEEYHKRLAISKNNNDKYRDGNVENEEELIDWLKDRLPSTCLFSKNAHFPSDIVIWI